MLCVVLGDNSKGSGPIFFYTKYQPFYEFTNFYEFAPFELDDKKWHSTEHYFQAQKFVGMPCEEKLHKISSSYQLIKWQRRDWDSVKLDVMYKALLAKFLQHERLRQLLLSTGDRKLIEHTPQ